MSVSPDSVDPNEFLREMEKINQQNLSTCEKVTKNSVSGANEMESSSLKGSIQIKEENIFLETTSQLKLTHVRDQDTLHLNSLMDDDNDDELLLQVSDEKLDNSHADMMKELFYFLEKDLNKLKEEVYKV